LAWLAAGGFLPSLTWGSGVEENTSKVLVAGDANLAAAALMNASGAGSSLFVINLCASMAPIANVAKALPGFESHRLYQVARREDGRTRYRLRLGFFTSEADAEAALNAVRSAYPTAFTACLCDEDKKFARGYVAEPVAPPKIAVVVENKHVAKPVAPAPAAKIERANATAKPVATKAAAPAPAKAPPQAPAVADDTGATNRMKALPSATAKPAPKAPAQPAKPPVSDAPVEIELSWDPPELQTPPAQANAPAPQVVAPTFKTQDVIKAPARTAPPAQTVAPKPAAAVTQKPTPPAAAKPAPDKPRVEAKPPTQPIEAPSKLLAAIELTLEAEPKPAPKPAVPATPSNEPFRVGKGVDIPTTSLSLESTQTTRALAPKPTAPALSAASTAAPKLAPETSKMKAAQANAPAAAQAAVAPSTQKSGPKLPDLDSTQTIRALTSAELENESQEKWFAIQLAVSDQPVNLDAMPRLDIFEAYRLYSVATAGSGKITHSLRIGFFREEVSAEAVCGYLKTFFASPTVVRISIAEQARFKDPPTAKPAPKAEVLDLSHARDRAPKVVPTVTMEVEKPRFDPNATGSFKASATGVHKALSSTGTNKALATGAHNALTATGAHRALGATGTHKALKPAAKAAPPATKRSAPISKANLTGKHKALQPKKTLEQQLLEEAREVELSQSGIRKLPKNDSLLSKMFGRKK